jgi:hypothetical protein
MILNASIVSVSLAKEPVGVYLFSRLGGREYLTRLSALPSWKVTFPASPGRQRRS